MTEAWRCEWFVGGESSEHVLVVDVVELRLAEEEIAESESVDDAVEVVGLEVAVVVGCAGVEYGTVGEP